MFELWNTILSINPKKYKNSKVKNEKTQNSKTKNFPNEPT